MKAQKNSITEIGIFSKTTDSSLIEALSYSNLDFIILDQEHGHISDETLVNHIRALKNSTCKAIVRVKELNHQAIGKALDLGADGVQVPNVATVQQALEAVNAARFFPNGNRGVCRFVTAADYGTKDRNEYFATSNEKTLILQVEGQEGINNLDTILDVQGYDILFIGPYDLSQSLGIPGDIENSLVMNVLQEVVEKAKKKGKRAGAFSDNYKVAKILKQSGFDYIAYSVDLNIFVNACNTLCENINN